MADPRQLRETENERMNASDEPTSPVFTVPAGCGIVVGETERRAGERRAARVYTETERKEEGWRHPGNLDRCRVIKSRPPPSPSLSFSLADCLFV